MTLAAKLWLAPTISERAKMPQNPSPRLPTRLGALIFRVKATGLQIRRGWQNWRHGIRRHSQIPSDNFPFLWAEIRSPLWDETGAIEAALQQGKVQNLRRAVTKINQVLVPANQTFSFWAQIGRATKRGGFASGRLLREGCLMPAIGGGLCQLSNALYQAALDCDLEIVERYAHSRVVPGSASESGRDATVAWNYIDLRFRAIHDFCIEA